MPTWGRLMSFTEQIHINIIQMSPLPRLIKNMICAGFLISLILDLLAHSQFTYVYIYKLYKLYQALDCLRITR